LPGQGFYKRLNFAGGNDSIMVEKVGVFDRDCLQDPLYRLTVGGDNVLKRYKLSFFFRVKAVKNRTVAGQNS